MCSRAVAVALQFEPDIAILDIDMPGLNGYEVAQRFRSNDAMKSLPLIAMTGHGTPADRKLTAEAGFDAHLTKPGNADALVAS